ncbi:MAG: DUF2000 domain-containing protein [Spirochaetes bacterium]|nr:DUF2000 domain-containing protein [Spirochaetota bacterium]
MKQIILINRNLTPGIAANTCAVIGMTFGKLNPEIVGCDISDKSNFVHSGITAFPVPVLSANSDEIREIYKKVQNEFNGIIQAVPFTKIAQSSKNYEEYRYRMSQTDISEIEFNGLGLRGDKKTINQLSGHMKLF